MKTTVSTANLILKQGPSVLSTSQPPPCFVSGSKRRLCYNGGCNQFAFAEPCPWTSSPSLHVGNDPSALLRTCPVSAFKVPGIFLEPLELSRGHCRGFTAQDALLAHRDTRVPGFGDVGRVCREMQSESVRQVRRTSVTCRARPPSQLNDHVF